MIISCAEISSGSSSSGASSAAPVLLWSEEFNNDIIDLSTWNFETGAGGYGNKELQNYTITNYHFEDDGGGSNNRVLVIDAYYINGSDINQAGSYTSLKITTQGKKAFLHGRIVARMKLDTAGQGGWPAFWMLGTNIADLGWPSCGEIDIMEFGKDSFFGEIGGAMHWGTALNDWHYETQSVSNTSLTNAYHNFEVVWDSSSVTWKLDGSAFYNLSTAGRTGSDFNMPFHILINLAIGGTNTPYTGFGKQVDTNCFPKHLYIDYVRWYSN
jgi:beta-glucanase (GH16 family)